MKRIVHENQLRSSIGNGESLIGITGERMCFTCCDCGLAHDIWPSYDPRERRIALLMKRNEGETNKARRRLKRNKEGIFKR